MKKRLKVLLTGASGKVGSGFIQEYEQNSDYQKKYELILATHKKSSNKKHKSRRFSLDNFNSIKKAMKGIDVVVHLAANSNPNSEFKDLVNPNLVGIYNVFQAAKESGVKRVVFASSIHAVKGYKHGYAVKHSDTPRPTNLYGATKAFAESMAYVFYENTNMSMLGIRIGAYTMDNSKTCISREDYGYVISQDDMSQLIHKCITAPENVKFGIFSGISKNKVKDLDLKFAKKIINYKPKDDYYKLCKHFKKPKEKKRWLLR